MCIRDMDYDSSFCRGLVFCTQFKNTFALSILTYPQKQHSQTCVCCICAVSYTHLHNHLMRFRVVGKFNCWVFLRYTHKRLRHFVLFALCFGINYSGTGQEVYTDGKWLAFMLEQILSNAIKYTPQGVVTIETACLLYTSRCV